MKSALKLALLAAAVSANPVAPSETGLVPVLRGDDVVGYARAPGYDLGFSESEWGQLCTAPTTLMTASCAAKKFAVSTSGNRRDLGEDLIRKIATLMEPGAAIDPALMPLLMNLKMMSHGLTRQMVYFAVNGIDPVTFAAIRAYISVRGDDFESPEFQAFVEENLTMERISTLRTFYGSEVRPVARDIVNLFDVASEGIHPKSVGIAARTLLRMGDWGADANAGLLKHTYKVSESEWQEWVAATRKPDYRGQQQRLQDAAIDGALTAIAITQGSTTAAVAAAVGAENLRKGAEKFIDDPTPYTSFLIAAALALMATGFAVNQFAKAPGVAVSGVRRALREEVRRPRVKAPQTRARTPRRRSGDQ
jgi:hypothetical protein